MFFKLISRIVIDWLFIASSIFQHSRGNMGSPNSGEVCGKSDALGRGFESIREEIIHPKKDNPELNPATKPFEEIRKDIIDESTTEKIRKDISTFLLELLLLEKKDGTLDYKALQKLGSNLTKIGAELVKISNQKVLLSDTKRDELLEEITEILEEILLRC